MALFSRVSSSPLLLAVCFTLYSASLFASAETCPQTVVNEAVNCSKFAISRGALGVKGIQLVDQYENVIQLRGVSSPGLQNNPECVTKEALENLVGTWGVNVYRAAVYIDSWHNGYAVNAAYFDDYIANIVGWCKDLGIYIIIDWHVIGDPNAHMDGWYQATTGMAVDFFHKYSQLYQNETHVLYEIANEPYNVNWEGLLWYNNIIIGTIRENDPDAIIIAGTTDHAQDIQSVYNNGVENTHNVLYGFHFYAATDEDLIPVFEEYMQKIPLFISQWGISAITNDGGYNVSVAKQYLDHCSGLTIVDSATIVSWLHWSYTDVDESASLLEPDACSSNLWGRTTCPGKYTENYFKSRAYDNEDFDCDTEVHIPRRDSNEEIGAFGITGIFLLIFFVVGCISSALYYHNSRKQKKENEKAEAAMRAQFPTKIGDVEFGALPDSPPKHDKTKETPNNTHTEMDLGHIYDQSETNESFTSSRKDSMRSVERIDERENFIAPPSPPTSESSQRSHSPPPSSLSSSSSLLSSRVNSSSSSGQNRRNSPQRAHSVRRQNSPTRGYIEHSASTRSKFSEKKPKRNTRFIKSESSVN